MWLQTATTFRWLYTFYSVRETVVTYLQQLILYFVQGFCSSLSWLIQSTDAVPQSEWRAGVCTACWRSTWQEEYHRYDWQWAEERQARPKSCDWVSFFFLFNSTENKKINGNEHEGVPQRMGWPFGQNIRRGTDWIPLYQVLFSDPLWWRKNKLRKMSFIN